MPLSISELESHLWESANILRRPVDAADFKTYIFSPLFFKRITDDHIERIVKTYKAFKDAPGFAHVASLEEIRAKDGNLSIPLYVAPLATEAREERAGYAANGLPSAIDAWLKSSQQVRLALNDLLAVPSEQSRKA